MKARKKWAMVLMTMLFVFLTMEVFLPGLLHAGGLDPMDPPGPTMHTLGEIYDKLETIEGKLPPCTECEAGRIPQTGQTASYAEEDDGNLKRGVDWPNPRFDNQGMIVTDKLTGLSWTKDANVFVPLSWNNALEACANCSEGNYADWRLPNLRELQSLIDYGQHGPALPHNHFFSNVQSNFYWSSTTSDAEIDLAWRVDLNDGSVKDGHKFYENYVWCVRGGL